VGRVIRCVCVFVFLSVRAVMPVLMCVSIGVKLVIIN